MPGVARDRPYRNKDGEVVAEEVAVLTEFGDADDYERRRQGSLRWLVDERDTRGGRSPGFECEGDLWYL